MIVIALAVAAALAAGRIVQQRRPEPTPLLVQRILAFMITVLIPIVTFVNVCRLEFDGNVLGGIVLGWVAFGIVGLLGAWAGPRLLGLSRPTTGSFINTGLQPNSGYLGLPIVGVLLGHDEITVAVGYDALVVAPVFMLGVFGVAAAYGTRAGEGFKQRLRAFLLRNPPLAGAILGLLAPEALAPDWAVDVTRVIIYAQLPLGCFAVGAILAAEGLRLPPPMTRAVAAGLALRLVVAPAILIGIAAPLIELPTSYAILAAMAPGLTGVGVAARYGLDVPYQSAAIVWGTGLVVSVGLVLGVVT